MAFFHLELKSAIVRPLLKKLSLDCEILKNYRPGSNLSFLSKVIEKVVASRFVDHMTTNNLMDPMKSAYRKGHSTEAALLRLHNDVVNAVDSIDDAVCVWFCLIYMRHLILLTTQFSSPSSKNIGLGVNVLDVPIVSLRKDTAYLDQRCLVQAEGACVWHTSGFRARTIGILYLYNPLWSYFEAL